jgi:hypothetical protein
MSFTGLRGTHLIGMAALLAVLALVAFRAPWAAETRGAAQVANVAVNCEPGQQALVRQIATAASPQVTVQCVTAGVAEAAAQPAGFVDQYGRVVPAGLVTPSSGYVPAVYTAPAAPVPAARAAAPARRTTTAARVEPKRSWKKTALVIGGTAGAGAGIGALVGGKKGALIGAAIGGGGASLYEAVKR